ncbi:hypothetical protein HDU67_009427 [Dinochytrium kinnereticum]|nr:hypothetical protein HDU67_009427 [Dinochytrium kinnereticum]
MIMGMESMRGMDTMNIAITVMIIAMVREGMGMKRHCRLTRTNMMSKTIMATIAAKPVTAVMISAATITATVKAGMMSKVITPMMVRMAIVMMRLYSAMLLDKMSRAITAIITATIKMGMCFSLSQTQ